MTNERMCMTCDVPMKKMFVTHKGMKFEARRCPSCRDTIFTEDLAMQAIAVLEAARLKKEYARRPIRIGHSWGITFPKELASFFQLDNARARLKISPDIARRKLEIVVV